MPLPNFLLVGAPDAGTADLAAALARHPALHLPTVREPAHFLADGLAPPPGDHRGPGDAARARRWVWDPDHYRQLFAGAPAGALTGEATPYYLWSRRAHERIRDTLPGVRLVVVLRDPVARAHAAWARHRAEGREPLASLTDACAAESARAARGWAPAWRYTGLGRYGEQLAHLYTTFPPDRIHVLRHDELVARPAGALAEVCAFLGVEARPLGPPPAAAPVAPSPGLRARWRALRSVPAPLGPAERVALTRAFSSDLEWLEDLTGGRYTDWLDPAPAVPAR